MQTLHCYYNCKSRQASFPAGAVCTHAFHSPCYNSTAAFDFHAPAPTTCYRLLRHILAPALPLRCRPSIDPAPPPPLPLYMGRWRRAAGVRRGQSALQKEKAAGIVSRPPALSSQLIRSPGDAGDGVVLVWLWLVRPDGSAHGLSVSACGRVAHPGFPATLSSALHSWAYSTGLAR